MSQQPEQLIPVYRLTTAEILYHLPDHPHLLQSYTWQGLDLMPRFPVLTRFLGFWEENLDGPIHSVRVATAERGRDGGLRAVRCVYTLH